MFQSFNTWKFLTKVINEIIFSLKIIKIEKKKKKKKKFFPLKKKKKKNK